MVIPLKLHLQRELQCGHSSIFCCQLMIATKPFLFQQNRMLLWLLSNCSFRHHWPWYPLGLSWNLGLGPTNKTGVDYGVAQGLVLGPILCHLHASSSLGQLKHRQQFPFLCRWYSALSKLWHCKQVLEHFELHNLQFCNIQRYWS